MCHLVHTGWPTRSWEVFGEMKADGLPCNVRLLCDVCQPDSPPDEDDYSCDDGGKEDEAAEYSQSYNASCKFTIFCNNYSNIMREGYYPSVSLTIPHSEMFHCICIIIIAENPVPRLSCACCRDSPVPSPPCSLWCLSYKCRSLEDTT